MFRKIAIALLIALLVIQFFRPAANHADGPQPHYIGARYNTSAEVKNILSKACNDCHSNNTKYPWYARVQPVLWWLDKHIRNGKKEINFDEFTHRRLAYQYHKLEETIEMVKEKEMPLNSYTWIHKDAKLSAEERTVLINWAGAIMDTMRARYPADSLVRKK